MSNKNINLPQNNTTSGVAYAFGAFAVWGIVPLFFKELSHVDALEFLSYRMVWAFVLVIILLLFRRPVKILLQEIRRTFAHKKLMFLLFISALLISSNWLVYIWAISHNRVLETSLGFYINPLMNVALGMAFLGERLSKTKGVAIGLAATGVIYMIVMGGGLPWVSLYLATSFALYGLVRKKVVIGAILGLWVEILMMLPFAAGYLIYLKVSQSTLDGGHDNYTHFMLIISGVVSITPLMFFAAAARRIPLSLIGIIQYLAPTITLLLSVFLWHEAFTTTHMVTFIFIWGGIILYTADMLFKKKSDHEPVIKG